MKLAPQLALLLLAGISLAGPARAQLADALITGTAVYDLATHRTSGAAAPSQMSGTLTASLLLECRAYKSETALSAKFGGGGMPPMPMIMSSSLIEEEGNMTFDLQGTLAGVKIEEAEGTATSTSDKLTVSLTKPNTKTIEIDGRVLFPVGLIRAVLAAAAAGKQMAEFRVYDGSGRGEEVWNLAVTISPVRGTDPEVDEEVLFATGLGFADLDRWRMRFSYFSPGGGGDQTPTFQTEAIIYENGFTLGTVYDFGQFALRLKLSEFKPVAPTPC